MTEKNPEVTALARELTGRLITRGLVPHLLRPVAEQYMQVELLRSIRRISRLTSRNAGLLLLARQVGVMGTPT